MNLYFSSARTAMFMGPLTLAISLMGCATPPSEPALPAPVPAPVTAPVIADSPAVLTVADAAVPSSERTKVLQDWNAQEARLYRVAAPLLLNNAKLCSRHARNVLGFTAKTVYAYPDAFAAEARASLGMDGHLRIMYVLPASGATQVDIRPGDALLKVDDELLPLGVEAEKTGAALIAAKLRKRPRLKFTLLRDKQSMVRRVPVSQACAMSLELGNTDQINSYADGNRIMITRGMLQFVRSDQELAFVIAREMAHNTLNPAARTDIKVVMHRLQGVDLVSANLDTTPMPKPFTPVLDATVDKLALYMLARADYPLAGVPSFWTRLAQKLPASVRHGHTALHPSSAYRLSVIKQIMLDIKQKQKHQWPMLP